MSESSAVLICNNDAVSEALLPISSKELTDFLKLTYPHRNSASEIGALLNIVTTHLHTTEYGKFALSQVKAAMPPLDGKEPAEIDNNLRRANAMRTGAAMMLDAMVELKPPGLDVLQEWAKKIHSDNKYGPQAYRRDADTVVWQAACGYDAVGDMLGNEVTRVGIAVTSSLHGFRLGAGMVIHHMVEADSMKSRQELETRNLRSVEWERLLEE